MADVYLTLNEAAELEEVKYNTMVQKIKRKPDAKVKIGIDMDDYYRIRENAESK